MTSGCDALTDKEKQVLRLIVPLIVGGGHDAKSAARLLDRSVHTINERLRDARRKLAVSSSREAARRLLAHEGDAHQSIGDTPIGGATPPGALPGTDPPVSGGGRIGRSAGILMGVFLMTLLIGLALLLVQPQPAVAPARPTTADTPVDARIEAAARRFLTLVDAGRWDDSYRLTGRAFRKMNSVKVWTDVSQKVRPPLGAVLSRTLLSQQDLPAPPNGYQVVKFRTRFVHKAETVETVTLEREGTDWRIVAVLIG